MDTVEPTPRSATAGGLDVLHADVSLQGSSILRGILFNLHPGELCAVIGPSRADKQMLIDVITGQQALESGQLLLGGKEDRAPGLVGYVARDDGLHSGLTIGEALRAAAALRLPALTDEERAQRVEAIATEVHVQNHLGARIAGLHTGQRKWVSMAIELLSDPSVLILDEPMQGLDPAAESEMMMMLEQVARGGRVVLVVTSASESLSRCDALLVLFAGRIAYFGLPEESFEYFGSQAYSDIIDRLFRTSPAVWHQICRTSMWNSAFMEREPPRLRRVSGPLSEEQQSRLVKAGVPSFFVQLQHYLRRSAGAWLGNPAAVLGAGGLTVGVGVGIPFLALPMGVAAPSAFGVASGLSGGLLAAVAFARERPVLAREHLYGLSLLASVLSTLGVALALGFVFVLAALAILLVVLGQGGVGVVLGAWAAYAAGLALGAFGVLWQGFVRGVLLVVGLALVHVPLLLLDGGPVWTLSGIGQAVQRGEGWAVLVVFGFAALWTALAVLVGPGSFQRERLVAVAKDDLESM